MLSDVLCSEDNELVIYDSEAGVIWEPSATQMPAGAAGHDKNNTVYTVFQQDGDLVQYAERGGWQGHVALWRSGTGVCVIPRGTPSRNVAARHLEAVDVENIEERSRRAVVKETYFDGPTSPTAKLLSLSSVSNSSCRDLCGSFVSRATLHAQCWGHSLLSRHVQRPSRVDMSSRQKHARAEAFGLPGSLWCSAAIVTRWKATSQVALHSLPRCEPELQRRAVNADSILVRLRVRQAHS